MLKLLKRSVEEGSEGSAEVDEGPRPKWSALSQSILQHDDDRQRLIQTPEMLQQLLELMFQDRFSTPVTLSLMAQSLVAIVMAIKQDIDGMTITDGGSVLAIVKTALVKALDGKSAVEEELLDLMKQLYVTVDDDAVRDGLVSSLVVLVESPEMAKATVRSGIPRSIMRVALDAWALKRSSRQRGHTEASRQDEHGFEECLSSHLKALLRLLQCIESYVCFSSTVKQDEKRIAVSEALCQVVVNWMLSGNSRVVEEAMRLMQMLLECEGMELWLVQVPDLRGALEKVRLIARAKDKERHMELVGALESTLAPLLDEYEKKRGTSMTKLDTIELPQFFCAPTDAIQLAQRIKTEGNAYFQRGNFATARLFYRRAITLMRGVKSTNEQHLAQLSLDEKQKRCTIGASVFVKCLSSSKWRAAMVSDVDCQKQLVEVLYNKGGAGTGKDDEDVVALERVRLQLDTRVLEALNAVLLDCSMNMGKALVQLADYENAAECFSYVLDEIDPTNATALYQRGVTHLALHQLQPAQQDLWQANHWARKQVGMDKAKRQKLLVQIKSAYARLKAAHESKKKLDRKVVKQMMRYLSTIPGLQEQ